ncbi:mitochondrial 54S ribosomal protein mL61 [Limtongia smithiae]|uniref:mitochondrial 54S ribosomal protein mL61 n=1 Tax=Limtongia smithiae TaxID=1125753 RepID=UPI0034CD55A5
MKSRILYQTKRLESIALGRAALILPTAVTNIKLSFKTKNSFGHMGARKFWRECLPSIQFHNPHALIEVIRAPEPESRDAQEAVPAELLVEFGDRPPLALDIKNMHSDEILAKFRAGTDAKPAGLSTFPIGTINPRFKLN